MIREKYGNFLFAQIWSTDFLLFHLFYVCVAGGLHVRHAEKGVSGVSAIDYLLGVRWLVSLFFTVLLWLEKYMFKMLFIRFKDNLMDLLYFLFYFIFTQKHEQWSDAYVAHFASSSFFFPFEILTHIHTYTHMDMLVISYYMKDYPKIRFFCWFIQHSFPYTIRRVVSYQKGVGGRAGRIFPYRRTKKNRKQQLFYYIL